MGKSFTIRPRKTAKGCVSQGARLLDAKRPGWEKTVHGAMVNSRFVMTDWDRCVAGTMELYKLETVDEGSGYTYEDSFISFNGLKFSTHDRRAIWIGFDAGNWSVPDGAGTTDQYEYLEQLWQAEVEKRLSDAQDA